MSYIFSIINRIFIPFTIVAIAAITRLALLDRIPNAVGGDELIYALTAKSAALTGTDISGSWHPLQALWFRYPPGEMQAELPYFIHLLFTGTKAFSLWTLRYPFALFGSIVPLLVYLIANRLLDRKTAIAAGLIAAINPWSVYISRTAYEATPATALYLAALAVLLIQRGKGLLWSIPLLMLGFYAYIGTKPILLPFVFTTLAYAYSENSKRKDTPSWIAITSASAALMLFFAMMAVTAPAGSRLTELAASGNGSMPEVLTLAGLKLIRTFSPDYLFLHGDNFFSLLHQGILYIADFPFILLGLAVLFAANKRVFAFLSAMIAIGIAPQLLHQASVNHFTPHITLAMPFFNIVTAYGIVHGVGLIGNKAIRLMTGIVVTALYIMLFCNFAGLYYFRHPMEGNFDFRVRLLSQYLSFSEQNQTNVTVYTNEAGDVFKKHLFYADGMGPQSMISVRTAYTTKTYSNTRLRFTSCDNTIDPSKTPHTLVVDMKCGMPDVTYPKRRIPKLTDGGEEYAIYNDTVCSEYQLKRFPTGITFNDFLVERMDRKRFCTTYITAP